MNRRLYLILEFVVLFIGIPVLFYLEWIPIPKVVALLFIATLAFLVLWFDNRYEFSGLFKLNNDRISLRPFLYKSLGVAFSISILVWLLHPSDLFLFPRERPLFWMVLMLLYPLLSALPQELIYREYFFQRYRSLFPSENVLGYASAIMFSALHIVYDNWWAIGLSLMGGFLFVHTYKKTNSLYWVSVEHALYGCLVFTIGMGNYFYEPF